jgi:3-hydroxyisobutyrate dehydrogenase-like beta-hydroxyacid dehydrogenase
VTIVAVLGTGRMGSAMSRALARSGFDLVLYNRSPDRARTLAAELGARFASSAAAAVRQADVALSMVADEDAVEALYREDGGVLEGLRPGVVVADMSTVPPSTILGLAPSVRRAGAGILDAPVSGSVSVAEKGELTIMVGGGDADLERARPVFDALAKRVFHLGPLGSGAVMKLAVNAVVFGLSGAISEALVLAERAGVERSRAYEVFGASVIGSPFVSYKQDAFLDPEGTPIAFSLDLAAKDMRLITGLAGALGVPMPQAATNLRVLQEATARGHGERDFSYVAAHLRETAEEGVTG